MMYIFHKFWSCKDVCVHTHTHRGAIVSLPMNVIDVPLTKYAKNLVCLIPIIVMYSN